jgi:hypothetical protein
MKRGLAVSIAIALAAGPALGASPFRETVLAARETAGPDSAPLAPPAFISPAMERPEIQVLLSSVDMTVSLIDAYGRCRDEDQGHEQCMAMIRATLAHARSMIGH